MAIVGVVYMLAILIFSINKINCGVMLYDSTRLIVSMAKMDSSGAVQGKNTLDSFN